MSKQCVKRWMAITNVLKPFNWAGKANFMDEPSSPPLKGGDTSLYTIHYDHAQGSQSLFKYFQGEKVIWLKPS